MSLEGLSTEKLISTLKGVSIFSGLSEASIKDILRITHRKRFRKGEVICHEGDPGEALYVVLSGKVKVSLNHEGKTYTLAHIEKGGFFGELSLLDGLPRSATCEALEDSEFLVIRREEFLRLLKGSNEISVELLKALAARLRMADERIKNLAFFTVEGRVFNYLLDYAIRNGKKLKDSIIVEKGPSNTEIADSCGCARETVSRVLKSLRKKGLIFGKGRSYIITPSYNL